MSHQVDRISRNTAAASSSSVSAPSYGMASPTVRMRRAAEAAAGAQAVVGMAAAGAKLISGDDGIRRPPPPPSARPTPTTPPEQTPPPATVTPPGLDVGVPGFPEGSIRTPGGYTIVPEGKDAGWKIFGPGQEFGDDAITRVWGDPHVNEKDGTRWDFTKDSNFQLPDGTVIRCDTTSETGHSLTQGLTIIAGNDRVTVSGVNTAHPTSTKSKDGDAWMNANLPTLMAGHTFSLQTDGKNVNWYRSTEGKVEGVVTGSVENFDGKHSYTQVINGDTKGSVDVARAAEGFGARGAGGLGFLGGFDAQAFLSQAVAALNALREEQVQELSRPRPVVKVKR